MKSIKLVLLAVTCLGGSLLFSNQVDGAWFHRSAHRARPSAYGGARPATGVGANLHRRFVLKQERKRAATGQRVRNRGNILWYR